MLLQLLQLLAYEVDGVSDGATPRDTACRPGDEGVVAAAAAAPAEGGRRER